MKDHILIKNLEFYAHHGVYEYETREGQRFIVSARLFTGLSDSGESDRLEETVHYGQVSEFLVSFLTENTYKLLEKAVQSCMEAVMLEFPLLDGIELTLQKPDAPIELEFETVAVTRTMYRHTAYIGLGSNMGDRQALIRAALQAVQQHPLCRVREVSDLIETEPYGGVPQDNFLNGAAEVETLMEPARFLAFLQKLEKEAGRVRTVKWGPRTLDLDILLFDDLIMGTKDLILPHPDMENREFVLQPMAQIAGFVRHPVSKKTMQQLLDELKSRQ